MFKSLKARDSILFKNLQHMFYLEGKYFNPAHKKVDFFLDGLLIKKNFRWFRGGFFELYGWLAG